ncbi:hypothetical protein FO519_001690 [Halicephalobus sp. NKZ332]|nr:hypothetical protein FO519_001690 [Halicephalobus sp. NKZ332]
MKLLLVFLFVTFVASEYTGKKQNQDPVKQAYLKRRTRQSETHVEPVRAEHVTQSVPQQPITIAVPTNMTEACTSADCSGKGTCFGTKQSPICLCQLFSTGPRCEDTYCDSNRDCNGHGICMGTSRQFSCFCSVGYHGERCDQIIAQPQTVIIVQSSPAPAVASAPHGESTHNH